MQFLAKNQRFFNRIAHDRYQCKLLHQLILEMLIPVSAIISTGFSTATAERSLSRDQDAFERTERVGGGTTFYVSSMSLHNTR
jgi:hypothetical protein